MFRGKHPSKRLSSREKLGEDLVECTNLFDRARGRRRFKRRSRRRKPMLWNPVLTRSETQDMVAPSHPRDDFLLSTLRRAFWILLIVAAMVFIIHQLTDMRFTIYVRP